MRLPTMLLSAFAVLLLSACGGDGEEAAPAEDAAELPETAVTATLDEAYKVGPDGSQLAFEEAELPVAPGSVEARWYRSEGAYVVHYAGLSLDETGPLCPGTSIQTAEGFRHVGNSPTAEGACAGARNLAGADAGIRVCGPLVLYVTEIPVETEGTLYGTLEHFEEDGTIVGVTSLASADPEAAPQIEVAEIEC